MRFGQDEGVDPTTSGVDDWFSQNAPPPPAGPPPLTADQIGNAGQGFSGDWAPGATGPSNAPPGYHWDATYATYVKNAPTGGGDPIIEPPRPPPPPPGPQQFGVPTSGFGAAPTPFASNPDAPTYTPMPTYVPPTWTGGDFQNPTEQDLFAMPGYQARLNAGLQARERSAAAMGTVLNGGTQKRLARYAGEEAAQSYQTLRNNSYDAYVQKYKQFTDAAGMDLNARTINANENQNTFANRTATYNTSNARSLSDYLTNLTGKRNSELDYWNRLQDVNQGGLSAATGSR